MAVFICDICHHIQETSNSNIGKNAKCPKCQESNPILDTLVCIKNLSEKNFLQSKLLDKLKQESQKNNRLETKCDTIKVYDSIPIDDFDIHNTDIFSKKSHYYPIVEWFKKQGIETKVDPTMMDTTGFFDEVAIHIGDYFNVVDSIIQQIKYIQSKKYNTVKITLTKKSNKETKQIKEFCEMLYDYSFIARSSFDKKNKVIYLTLQEIPKIKSFFNGCWMEWFVLIKLISLFKENNITPPLVRSLKISFSNNDTNELDIFFINKQKEPVCIECKTGEFRQDLNKYFSLKKKLNIKKENFILCVFGLSNEQAKGLTSMYEITLVNESTLIDQIKSLI